MKWFKISFEDVFFNGLSNAEIGILIRYRCLCQQKEVDALTWEQICFNFDRKDRKVISKLVGISPEVDPEFTQSSPEVEPKYDQSTTEVRPKLSSKNNDVPIIYNINNNTIIKTEKREERDKKDKRDCADAPSKPEVKNYAFEGKVIRLNQKDFDNWQKAYPDLNLYAECLQRDAYLAKQPPDEQKRWYVSTSAYFIKQNERRKLQNREFGDEQESDEDWLRRSVM